MNQATIRVNLLGRAEVLRVRRRRQLMVQSAVSVALGLVLATGWLAWQHDQLDQQRKRNAAQALELALLESGAKEAAALLQALKAGKQRRQAWQGLAPQTASAQALVELAQALPTGVRLKRIQQEGDTLLVAGTAASGEQLAALMTAWAAPERVWRRLELVRLGASVPSLKSAPTPDPLPEPSPDPVPESLGAKSSTPTIEPVASRSDELDFSIRLRRQPLPALP